MRAQLVLPVLVLLLLGFTNPAFAIPLRYDFSGEDATALVGMDEAVYSVADTPLLIQSGALNMDGDFFAGGGPVQLPHDETVYSSTTLGIWEVRGYLPTGLGVRSLDAATGRGIPGIGGHQVGPGEGIRFAFDPQFVPTSLTLSFMFGDGSPGSEDARIFGDGEYLMDVVADDRSGMVEIDLRGYTGLSSLSMTTRNCAIVCSGLPMEEGNNDFVVSYIDGFVIPVSEPGGLLIILFSVLGLSLVQRARQIIPGSKPIQLAGDMTLSPMK